MKNVRHNEHLGILTLGVVFVDVAHMWRVMQSETENQALFVDFYGGSFGLVFRGLELLPVPRPERVFVQNRRLGVDLSSAKAHFA